MSSSRSHKNHNVEQHPDQSVSSRSRCCIAGPGRLPHLQNQPTQESIPIVINRNHNMHNTPMQFPFNAYRHYSQTVFNPYSHNQWFRRGDSANRNIHQRNGYTLNGARFWQKVSSPDHKKGFVFTVMSYNVLAQNLIHQHPHLYTAHSKRDLKWELRWENIIHEITTSNPDIICLQEVQDSHLTTHFSLFERLGYGGLFKKRTGERSDGCAIYFKHDLFNLLEYTTVEYNQPNVAILNRDNVGIIARLATKEHQQEFVIATTHLLYNPKRQDVRLAQTQILLAEVERMAYLNSDESDGDRYLPIILTGDLNSTPESAVYHFIRNAHLNYEHLGARSLLKGQGSKTGKKFLPISLQITDHCQHAKLLSKRQEKGALSRAEELELVQLRHSDRKHTSKGATRDSRHVFESGSLRHKFAFNSVYKHYVNNDIEGSTFQDEWLTVDYIFYSSQNSSGLQLLDRFVLPTARQLHRIQIPNKDLGSDHLSLLARFKLFL